MANVVDPNSWRMTPLSDSQHSRVPNEGASRSRSSHPDNDSISIVSSLADVLGRLFDRPGDRVVWNFLPSPVHERAAQHLRLDPRHATALDTGDISTASAASASDATALPWLVIVENAGDNIADGRLERLQTTLGHAAQLLVVACDIGSAAAEKSKPTETLAAAMAKQLQCEYVGPLEDADAGQLASVLAGIKRGGRPTLLYLNARHGTAPPPHFAPPAVRPPQAADVTYYAHRALQTLSQMAGHDQRIVAIATNMAPELLEYVAAPADRFFAVDSLTPYALAWSASLATGGSRPFMFLSSDDVQNSLGQIRRDLCLARSPVTLLISPGTSAASAGSGSLAGLHCLPHGSLASPKNGQELAQLIRWTLTQDDPVAIWLPEDVEPNLDWPPGPEILDTSVERLGQGNDVLLLAWGPMVAAATMAAKNLELCGLSSTVLNVRFARPLDIATIGQALGDAKFVVLLDDELQHGGFAAWVAEELLKRGIAQPWTIVSPPAAPEPAHPHMRHYQCALNIVERCRWLAEPIGARRLQRRYRQYRF